VPRRARKIDGQGPRPVRTVNPTRRTNTTGYVRDTGGRRQAYRDAVHPGLEALGVRTLSRDVGSFAELDRVEQRLRALDAFTDRQIIGGAERFEAVRGLDPDRLPLAFVAQQAARTMTAADYERAWTGLYGMDV
jgi:hypothetical protein